jgi:oxygen-independent coproporphyrinogen-3 oxidase
LGNWAYQNVIELDRYSELIEQEQLPVFRGHVYNALELMTRDVLLGMKLLRFDRHSFQRRHGVDVVRFCEPAVARLEDEGFITVDDDAIVLTEKGILYGDHAGRILASSLESLANRNRGSSIVQSMSA